jgi:O-antigen/teichoic acid export membrane protein
MGSQSVPALTAQQGVEQMRDLDRSLVHGIAWTGAAKWAGQLVAWASTLIVARLLTPEDYGLVGMATIYLGLITLVSEFGLGTTVITLRNLREEEVAQLNGLSLLVGVGSFALSGAAAIPLGRWFHAPELPAVVVAMSAAFVITAFKTVPFSLLQREMRFRALALVETGRAVLLAVSMIAFALLGLRYWTLVIGGLLSSVLSTGATLALRRHRLAWPRRQSLTHAMSFSRDILVARLCWYTYSNADFLVAGRILGKAALGLYDFGWNLANIPIDRITSLVGQVTPSVFSAVQNDAAALRRYLLRITEGLALITLPASLGMALVAPDFVLLALGQKWQGAIVPLQLLAVSTGFRAVTPLLSQVLNAVGQSRVAMRYSVLWALVLPTGFYVLGRQWGTVGLALVWVCVFPLLAVPAYRRALRAIDLPGRAYLLALWPATSASFLMAASVLAVRLAVGEHGAAGLRFGSQVVAGAGVYVLTCMVLHRERITAFSRMLRTLRAAPPPASEVPVAP